MYTLRFTNKYGREIELKNYDSKMKANRHGDMLMMARETASFQVISVDTPVPGTVVTDKGVVNNNDLQYKKS